MRNWPITWPIAALWALGEALANGHCDISTPFQSQEGELMKLLMSKDVKVAFKFQNKNGQSKAVPVSRQYL